jgi:hypothetical protein
MAEQGRPRSDGFDGEKKAWFVAALRAGETVLGACALVGISNRTAYNHRNRDPEFARLCSLAQRVTRCPAELAAFERAVGVEEPVYAYGKFSHMRTRRSDALLIALLKAQHPRRFGAAAGLRGARAKIERKVAARLARELAPLFESSEAELSALRTVRSGESGDPAVNFVNPPAAASQSPARRPRRGKRRAATRLDTARRRAGEPKTFEESRFS